jgi:hypothetical protein
METNLKQQIVSLRKNARAAVGEILVAYGVG